MSGRGVIFPRSHRTMLLHKWATVDDIAAPIVFLLSDGAATISGVTLPIRRRLHLRLMAKGRDRMRAA